MEDAGSILWIAFIVAISIYGSLGKRGKNQRSAPASPEPDGGGKPAPQFPVFPVPASAPKHAHRAVVVHAKSEAERPETGGSSTKASIPPAGNDTAASEPRHRTELAPAENRESQADKDKAPAAGFNLRDAIIYSEILKPKFDE